MDRREALQTVAAIMGGTVIGAQAFLQTGCGPKEPDYTGLLTENGYETWIEEVAETILPKTALTPGAKDAAVGRFINIVVTECYDEAEQEIFLQGITALNERSREAYQRDFDRITPEQRNELLLELEEEVSGIDNSPASVSSPHYYTMMKQLSLLGFLTSEVGMTQAMRYEPVPGRYDACIPYREGDKAWAG